MKNIKNKKVHLRQSQKVFVGLSGGVDSAVSAVLLKKQNYEVTGVFIKAWTPPFDFAQGTRKQICGWKDDKRSAMRAAAVLDIPFITLDLEKEYKKEVVDYMIAEYKKGRTPNPDVMCNKEIKFGHFLKFALKKGADFVATGHYARISHPKLPRKDSFKKSSGLLAPLGQTFLENFSGQLLEGSDKNKDQSYFLWTLTQKQLKHVLFPIGNLQKDEVRKLAQKFGLPQATRKDSQGLCFLGKVDMKEFLSRYIKSKRGDVLKALPFGEGLGGVEVIGHHPGALFFTIGERHGFTVTKKTTEDIPLYVVAKDIKENTITVAPIQTERSSYLYIKEVKLNKININSKIPSKKILCRIRYRQEKIECKVKKMGGQTKVIFDRPQAGVSAGQSLVLYEDEICLGGGIIA